jgi:hypothetical protein
MGTSAITGINLGVPGFTQTFTSGTSLVVNHNLNSQYLNVTVFDENDIVIIPDNITATDANTMTIDVSSFTVAATWRVVVTDVGASVSVPIPTDLNMSGQAAEDTLFYDGANWQPAGGTSKIYVDSASRNMTLPSGTQTTTSIPFKPSAVIFFSARGGSVGEMCMGLDDGTRSHSITDFYNTTPDIWSENTSFSIRINQGGGNTYEGTITAFTADGFTITWTRTGAPTGIVGFYYMAFR